MIEKQKENLTKKYGNEHLSDTDSTEKWFSAFIRYAVEHNICSIASHAPLADEIDQSMLKIEDRDTIEYPKRLKLERIIPVNGPFFLVLNDQDAKRNRRYLFYAAIVLFLILICCLFPVWPFKLKYYAWSFVYYLSLTYILISVLRLVLFTGLWFFCINFWLFPNLYDEDLGVIDSFIPLYSLSFEKPRSGSILTRVIAILLLTSTTYQLNKQVSFMEFPDTTYQLLSQAFDWGVNKISFGADEIVVDRYFDEMLPPHERLNKYWELCSKGCDFESFSELKSICYFDCQCLKELKDSRCTTKCEHEVVQDFRHRLQLCETNPEVIANERIMFEKEQELNKSIATKAEDSTEEEAVVSDNDHVESPEDEEAFQV